MRRSPVFASLIMIMLVVSISSYAVPTGRAAQTYTPGVAVGNSITYGDISIGASPGATIPQSLQIFNETTQIVDTVTSVSATTKLVSATQTYYLKKGGTNTTTISGSVLDGSGNLSIFIVAGGLNVGDPLYQCYQTSCSNNFFGFITQNVTASYLGALRTVNEIGGQLPSGAGFNFLKFSWDRQTGFLLGVDANTTGSTTGTVSIHIKATSTNVWPSSSTPDFSFDAKTSTYLYNYLGQATTFNLNLTSYNTFTGTINLSDNLLNSSLTNPPTLNLAKTSLNLGSGLSSQTTLTFSTSASTPLGLYLFSVNANGASKSHTDFFALQVQPPTFAIFAPPSVSLAASATKAITVTVEALGLFTGTVGLSAISYNSLFEASLNISTITLSATTSSHNATLTLASSPYIIPQTFQIYVTGNSFSTQGPVTQYAFVNIQITGPDFQVTSPSSITVSPGGTGSVTATITSVQGFAGTVDLYAATSGGLAASASPTSVTISSGSPGTSTLTVTVPSNTPTGSYSATIAGVSDLLSSSAYVSVNVGGPDFMLTAGPSSFPFTPGTSVQSAITLSSLGGFQGNVALAVGETSYSYYGSSSPLAYNLSLASVNVPVGGSASSTLTISIPKNLPANYYSIEVTAQAGLVSHSITIAFTTTSQTTGPYFTLAVDPLSLTVNRGGSGNYTIGLTSFNGFQGQISLSTSIQGSSCPGPYCPTGTFTHPMVNLPAGGSVTANLMVNVPPATTPGSYSVSVYAQNGTSPPAADGAELVVAGPDYQLFFNSNGPDIVAGGSATPKLLLASLDGFSGSISITPSMSGPGCPGVSCPGFSFTSLSESLSSGQTTYTAVSITTVSTTPAGFYTLDVPATNGTLMHDTSLFITVEGPFFSLTSSPYPLILSPGGSGSIEVSAGSLNAYKGNVTLTAAVSSPDININFTPVNLTLHSAPYATASIGVSVPSTTNPGSYSIDITGKNATLEQFETASVFVVGPDFGIQNSGPSGQIQAGTSVVVDALLTSLDGFRDTISLNGVVTYGPFGVCPGTNCPTISFNNPTAVLSSAGWQISNYTITVPAGAQPGTYYATVGGQIGNLQHTSTFTFDVSPPPASLLSVVVGSDGLLYYSHFTGAWPAWTSLDGSAKSSPSICSSGPGDAELLVRGNDDGIYHQTFAGGVPSGTWDTPGGTTIDQPACAILNGILYLVVRGSDNGVYANSFFSGFWTGWISLGGATQNAPVLVASPQANRLDLIVRGMDNGVYHMSAPNGAWTGSWDTPGGSTIDTPAATTDELNLYVAVRGSDNATYLTALHFSNSVWSSWASLGGKIISAPYIGFDAAGNFHILVRGLDNGIYHISRPAGGSLGNDWGLPIGYTQDTPSAANLGPSLVLAVRGGDNGIYYQSLTGITLADWLHLGGSTHLAPSLSTT